jgi:multidrug efflux pump subunit AcrB
VPKTNGATSAIRRTSTPSFSSINRGPIEQRQLEDQGAFFISVQLPDGASVSRTSQAVRDIERVLRSMPQVQNVFAVAAAPRRCGGHVAVHGRDKYLNLLACGGVALGSQ